MKPVMETGNDKRDVLRQFIVAVSAIVAVVGSFIGSGAAGGTEIQKASGGALAADATLVAPHGPAFAIWSLIYAGLLAYAVWQFLPSQRRQERHRRIGYPVAASLLLNAAWILSIQFDQLWLSVPVIIILLAVLLWIFVLLREHHSTSRTDGIITDGSLGLYLGWVSVATLANISAWTVAEGFSGFGMDPVYWTISAVLAAVSIGVVIALYGRGGVAPAASLAWGLSWIAVARLIGDLKSTPVAVVALVGAVVIIAVTVAARVKVKAQPAVISRTGGR